MASEERDRIFDKTLARHWRSAAASGEAPGIPGESAPRTAACPDAETLAACHERSLFPEQLNSLKEHIVGCANCQAVLSSLEITDEIPLQAAEEEQVLAQAADAPAAVSAQEEAAAPEARPFKSRRRVLLFRGARWQWLAPAGAIAAGLLVYIALHENRSLPLPKVQQNETRMAENKVPVAPIPSGREELPKSSAPVAKPPVALSRPQSTLSEPAMAADGRGLGNAEKQSGALGGAAGVRSRDAGAESDLRKLKDRESDTAASQAIAANSADLDTKNLSDTQQKKEASSADKEKLQAELAQLQQQQAQNYYNQNVTPKAGGPSQMNQVAPPAKAKSAPVPSANTPVPAAAAGVPAAAPPPAEVEVSGAVSSYSDATTMNLKVARAVSNPRLIPSPSLQFLWRVGRSGLIEFSKDSGTNWSRQTSGITADLLTGFAPNDQVCWIVGKASAILLTTDGGAHWKSVSSPLTEDLGGVRAADAVHATIWNARGTKSFLTSDGGLTWTPVPHP